MAGGVRRKGDKRADARATKSARRSPGTKQLFMRPCFARVRA
jgi:hypothetical protein